MNNKKIFLVNTGGNWMTTHKMESLIYTYFQSGSLAIVPRVTKNNAWLDTEADPMI